jgi:acyl-coenzyme A thioesterase PaaI-like protein
VSPEGLTPSTTKKELPHTHHCFVCGESNSRGLNLRFHTNGTEVEADYVPAAEHSGFSRTVHGGLLSTVLDEIMVWACAVGAGKFAYCAELNVRFLKPVQPGQRLQVRARLTGNKRDRLYEAEGEVVCGTEVHARATGKYMPIRNLELKDMVGEMVGDASWLFGDQGTSRQA